MSNIYTLPIEVSEAIEKLNSLFDSETGELLSSEEEYNQAQAHLDSLANQTNETTEWYLKERANTLAYIAWIESEIDRLSKIVTREKKKVSRFDNLLESSFKRSYRKSEAVLIENELWLPKEFLRVVPETVAPDKIAIKKALSEWKSVPWASLETRQSFSIK